MITHMIRQWFTSRLPQEQQRDYGPNPYQICALALIQQQCDWFFKSLKINARSFLTNHL